MLRTNAAADKMPIAYILNVRYLRKAYAFFFARVKLWSEFVSLARYSFLSSQTFAKHQPIYTYVTILPPNRPENEKTKVFDYKLQPFKVYDAN